MDSLGFASSVFNRSRFQTLTLHDKELQASLFATFFEEAEQLRGSIVATAHEGAGAFSDAVHRLRNIAHFIGGDRLALLLAGIRTHFQLARQADRNEAACLIVQEIGTLERALAEERAGLAG